MQNHLSAKLLAEFIGTFAFVFIGAGAAAQAASTAASAYSYSAARPKLHHARHRSTFVPRAATAQVPEVGDSSCYLENYYSFAVNPAGHVHRLMTMCGPQ